MEKNPRWLMLLLALVSAGGAQESRLVVRVNNQASFDDATLAAAQHGAARVFAASGVQVEWQNAAEAGRPDLLINLVAIKPAVMGGRGDEAGFAAVPADGQPGYLIWVFRPLLERIVDDAQYRTPVRDRAKLTRVLLAHIMAHEMGHLLLNTVDHPDSGIMTRIWRLDQIVDASTGRLGFTPRETGLIGAAVRARNPASLSTASLPSSPRPARR